LGVAIKDLLLMNTFVNGNYKTLFVRVVPNGKR
jgi:hypothetical protein